MTLTALDRDVARPPAESAVRCGPVVLAVLLALPIALALSWPGAVHVWETGDFPNTDDATRAVQIRDWMAGQAWFDLTAHRMGLPSGLLSHWSRVVDVPVAGLIRMFELGFAPDRAERAARIAFPLSLQVALMASMAYAARVLAGPAAAASAGVVIVAAGIGVCQFEPGRIHHHAPQIVLLTLAAASVLDALDPARASRAALAGVAAAFSLAIGLENLPFQAVLFLVLPTAWALQGRPFGPALLWFAGALGLACLVLYVALVPPARYGASTVDAFSEMHLAAIEGGCALSAAAALLMDRLRTRARRFAFTAAGGSALAAALLALFPDLPHGPFYGMDPLLHPFWLDDVMEVRPLVRFAGEAPGSALILMGPMLAGAIAAAVAARRSAGIERARWTVLLALVAVGFAGCLWGMRVAFSVQPLALLGGTSIVGHAWCVAKANGRARALWQPAAALGLFSTLAWAALPLPGMSPVDGDASCFMARAVEPLAALGERTAFAPIDAGPYLLAHTRLSVLAGPYHRDNAGLRAVIEGFLAPPETAEAMVRATGARYVVTCGHQTSLEVKAAPDGLAAALARGDVPHWLVPVDLGSTPFRVYEVR